MIDVALMHLVINPTDRVALNTVVPSLFLLGSLIVALVKRQNLVVAMQKQRCYSHHYHTKTFPHRDKRA